MKQKLFYVLSLAVVGGTFAGCDTDETTACSTAADCAGFACVIADGETEGVCSTTACGPGYVAGTDSMTGDAICVAGSGCTDCGAYACNTATNSCFTECTDGAQCADDAQCDDTATPGECVVPAGYMYIAVVSRAEGADALNNPNPGPDLDAISISAGGSETFATTVEASFEGPEGDETNTRPLSTHAAAVTAKDTVVAGICDLDAQPGYVAIGGDGGFIVVSFGREIATGDDITVYEVDSNYCADAATERPDAYDVYIGTEAPMGLSTNDITSGWCLVGSQGGNGGVFTESFDASACAM